MRIRQIQESDSGALLSLSQQIDEETKFMLFEPGERNYTPEQQLLRVKNILESGNSMIFVAEIEGKLAGHLSVFGGQTRRNRHCGHIAIGILAAYIGQGIGTALFRELETWARANHMHRLELNVMTHNNTALALYKKIGFEIEGTKRHNLLIDGEYVDEYQMGKLL